MSSCLRAENAAWGEVGTCHTAEGGNRTRDPQILCQMHCGVANQARLPTFELTVAAIAQLGERQTEDLKVPSSILGVGSLDKLACDRGALGKRDAPRHESQSSVLSLFLFSVSWTSFFLSFFLKYPWGASISGALFAALLVCGV